MNQREDLIQELNQLLKGTHMGAFLFEDLRDKLMDRDLKQAFHQYLTLLKEHEEMITTHIHKLGGESVDHAGVMGTISDVMSMIKNMTLLDDQAVITEAMKGIEMGMKALRNFDECHFNMSQTLNWELDIMRDDYHIIFHSLHKHGLLRKKASSACS